MDYFANYEEIMAATPALDQAREILTFAAEADTTYVRANYEAGHIYLITINRDDAVKYFLRVFRQEPNYKFDIEYRIGKSYQYGLQFDKAIRYYKMYKDKLTAKSNYQGKDKVDMATVDRAIKECENGKVFVANPQNYSIKNIGREINTEYHDYAPVLSEAETEIIFTSRRKDDNLNPNVDEDVQPYEDIYFAKRKPDNTWDFAKNIGDRVNTLFNESSLALSADGKTLFIYYDDNGGDIYYSKRMNDGDWGPPVPLPGIINSSFQEKSISISKDESTLYFTSDRPGGYGKSDIYKVTKNSKGEWSSVKTLGPMINTAYEDDGPFIDYDGVTLYFSSKGHNGMGGHDIYRSKVDPKTGEWSEPVNMGYPINTPDDDVFFVAAPDSKKAFYSSIRDDGKGFTDIYEIIATDGLKNSDNTIAEKQPEPVKQPEKKDTVTTQVAKQEPVKQDPPKQEVANQDPPKQEVVKKDPPKQEVVKKDPPKKEPVKTEPPKKQLIPLIYAVSVLDENGNPLDAQVKLVGAKDNIVAGSTSTSPGVVEFKITNATAKDYRLTIEANGYIFENQTIRIGGASDKEQRQTKSIRMRKLQVGVSSILRNLYFDYDKASFKTNSYQELNKLEEMMRQNANLKVEISGHTDSFGNANYNKQLSQRRAEAVKDYLTGKGVDPRRIKAVGYGESKPLASNDDEAEGREINRRVEFKVLQN